MYIDRVIKQEKAMTTEVKHTKRRQLEALEAQELLEAICKLSSKYRSKIIFSLLLTLPSEDVEFIRKKLPEIIADLKSAEEAEDKAYAKIEYKHLSSGDYAYIREWGSIKCNIYMGRMYLRHKHKYRARNKEGLTKTFVSLGLHRFGDSKVYLRIHQLDPVDKILEHEFFDINQKSKAARETLREKIEMLYLPRGGWKLQDLGEQDIDIGHATPTTQYTAGNKPNLTKIKNKIDWDSPILDDLQDKSILNLNNLFTQKVEVSLTHKHIDQILKTLEDWVWLSKVLSKDLQGRIIRKQEYTTLIVNSKQLVKVDTSLNKLLVISPELLINWLKEIFFAVVSSRLVDEVQKSQASRWLSHLESTSKNNGEDFIKSLLYL
jgi:hypothetical protein